MKPKPYTTNEIIEYFGGVTALADRLGCTKEAVLMWRGFVPLSRAYEIQHLSNFRFRVARMPMQKMLKSALEKPKRKKPKRPPAMVVSRSEAVETAIL